MPGAMSPAPALSLCLPLLALVACPPPPAPKPTPEWFEAARAREGEPLAALALASEDGALRALVPARLARPIAADRAGYRLWLGAGAGSPIECLVTRKDELDPAGSLVTYSKQAFDALGASVGRIAMRRIDAIDAGAFGASPYLGVSWLYRVEAGDGARVGQVKHLLATKAGRSVYCRHHELGHVRTFLRVVAALVESLELRDRPSPPSFSQISTRRVREMRVGFEHTTLVRERDGELRVETHASMLLPVDGETLEATDSLGIERARPDGSLIEQVYAESKDGRLVTKLELDPASDGAWRVSGIFQTRPLERTIARGRPTSFVGETLAARTVAVSPVGAAVKLQRWVPAADPTQILEQTLTLDRRVDRDRFAAKLEVAGIEADLVFDPAGLVASGAVASGPERVEVERVFSGGAL
jgi:hypothetical protein